MPRYTIQRCPCCERFYRHGCWIELDEDQLKALDAAVYAGQVEVLDASCIDCEENQVDGLGHA